MLHRLLSVGLQSALSTPSRELTSCFVRECRNNICRPFRHSVQNVHSSARPAFEWKYMKGGTISGSLGRAALDALSLYRRQHSAYRHLLLASGVAVAGTVCAVNSAPVLCDSSEAPGNSVKRGFSLDALFGIAKAPVDTQNVEVEQAEAEIRGIEAACEEGGGPSEQQPSGGSVADPSAVAATSEVEEAGTGLPRSRGEHSGAAGWKLLWTVMAECWLPLLTVSIITIGLATLTVLLPSALGNLYDVAQGEGGRSMATVARIACIVGAQGALQILQVFVTGLMKKAVEARLRLRVMRAMLAQDTAFFDIHRTSALGEHLTTDVREVCDTLQRVALHGVQDAVLLMQGVVTMFMISPKLFLLVMATVPPGTALLVGLGTLLRHAQSKANTASVEAHGQAVQALSALRTVRAFSQEDREAEEYTKALQHAGAKRLEFYCVLAGVTTSQ
ncbi:hypothetical protein CYMTET_8496 [Cymbomonas tetramitiformis]|uniref:ABC transmembrane type-1 domain-containing protein n=1 Tax=Cymbomonas tetramitiformis TaxID=36881 RepID=A0AAE0GSY5_9CHLO|nr:hypothetical protein CYMTET_8496 [Cymbomonas tetramitiformis]